MIRSPELAPTSVAHRYGLSILTSLILFSLPSVGQADEAKHWRIAILRSGDPAQPAFAQMDRSFRQTIEAAAPAGVEFTTDAIDGLRFSGADLAPELVAMLRKKYAAHQVDLVVVIGDVALDLADRYRDEVWPGIPIMAGGIEDSRLEARGRPLDMPVAPLRVDIGRTLAVIEALQPSATNLIVISGMSPVDRRWLDRASRTAAQRPSRAWNIEQWVGLSIEELQRRLKAVPRNTAVLYTTMYQDHAGRRYFPVDAVRPMVQASAVPIYGWYANFVEQGLTATGGPMDFPQEGKRLGDMALAMLAGRPTTRYTEAPSSNKCVVNVGQLEALGLDLDTAPAHCQLINWPPSVWRDHRGAVIAIAAIMVLQGASIAALLTLRRQRQSAEREAARRRVELANASRVAAAGELSASIAHEVGQPLGAILSNTDAAEMILDTGIDDEGELREILADVRRDAVRANSVVRRLRTLLQERNTEFSDVVVDELLTETRALLQPEARQRDMTLEVLNNAHGIHMRGDAVQLQQTLLNLALNAMDAMRDTPLEQRVLTIEAERTDGRLEFRVIDRGHGIAADAREHLFESFFTTKAHGMGLGLSLSRTIVGVHGGELVARDREDGGSVFVVRFPPHTFFDASDVTAAHVDKSFAEPRLIPPSQQEVRL